MIAASATLIAAIAWLLEGFDWLTEARTVAAVGIVVLVIAIVKATP